jgi:hypothetical protein
MDRDSFGCEYVPHGAHGWDKATLMLRFMHEVCNIPCGRRTHARLRSSSKMMPSAWNATTRPRLAPSFSTTPAISWSRKQASLSTSRRRKERRGNRSGKRCRKFCIMVDPSEQLRRDSALGRRARQAALHEPPDVGASVRSRTLSRIARGQLLKVSGGRILSQASRSQRSIGSGVTSAEQQIYFSRHERIEPGAHVRGGGR